MLLHKLLLFSCPWEYEEDLAYGHFLLLEPVDRKNCLHSHNINFYLHKMGFTIEDKGMLLADCDCHYTLTNIDESRFLTIFQTFPPSGEEARLEGMLMSAGSNGRWLMYFWVAAIDLKFFDPGGLLEFGDIKSLHSNDYRVIIKGKNAKVWNIITPYRDHMEGQSHSPVRSLLSNSYWTMNEVHSYQNNWIPLVRKLAHKYQDQMTVYLTQSIHSPFLRDENLIWFSLLILFQDELLWFEWFLPILAEDLEDFLIYVLRVFFKIFFVLTGGLPLSELQNQIHHVYITNELPE